MNLSELREALKLRPMAEFDPDKPARIYDNLNETFFDWDPKSAEQLPTDGASVQGQGL